jgi:general secretion pathway protein A
LDAEETRAYIEHRLKHVGWKGDPRFEADAFEAVFEVSHGIPRRINAVCDRLMLCGFLGEKRQFRRVDVVEVAEEFNEETEGPQAAAEAATPAGNDELVTSGEVELLRQLRSDPIEDAQRIVSNVSRDDMAGRLVNLEASMLRLERNMLRLQNSTAASLMLLGQLVERMHAAGARRETGSKK